MAASMEEAGVMHEQVAWWCAEVCAFHSVELYLPLTTLQQHGITSGQSWGLAGVARS